jgi:hypothetical protein
MTYWFSRAPGQTIATNVDNEDHDERLDDHVIVVGADHFDWVRVPAETPHPDAGRQLRVERRRVAPCPRCSQEGDERPACWHYEFEGSSLIVAECLKGHDFLWYQLKPSVMNDEDPTD